MPGDWAVQEVPLAVPCLGTKLAAFAKRGCLEVAKKGHYFLTFLMSLGISFVYNIHPRMVFRFSFWMSYIYIYVRPCFFSKYVSY